MLFNNVPLRIRRALSHRLCTCSDSTCLVLNRTSLNSINALLALWLSPQTLYSNNALLVLNGTSLYGINALLALNWQNQNSHTTNAWILERGWKVDAHRNTGQWHGSTYKTINGGQLLLGGSSQLNSACRNAEDSRQTRFTVLHLQNIVSSLLHSGHSMSTTLWTIPHFLKNYHKMPIIFCNFFLYNPKSTLTIWVSVFLIWSWEFKMNI